MTSNSGGRARAGEIVLITGGSEGIGYQVARKLAAEGLTVLLGVRDLVQGRDAASKIDGIAHAIPLDVTDADKIAAAAELIRRDFGRIDILINNAAIVQTGGLEAGTSFDEYSRRSYPSRVSLDEVRAVWETNVFGVLAVTQAMLPLLRQAPQARIVNISSGVGSLTLNADPAGPYRSIYGPLYGASKTALNALTVALAIELEAEGIKVNAACPGFTRTALTNYTGTQTAEEAARHPVRMALIGADGPTGSFSDFDGALPW
ncbi:SDR family NAD(P)-dependent oxidoreductase [Sphingomonas sp. SRS2]|uniref:SDR family NAD(P)-dependent oxidoreductase n=1 Tax=Sphingomonas sp. SRS2 TaxID=133190 RepID=UPI0006184A6E|nr:SDR family NAD(P)-dependent oxidoreductase [Sphingomonas sp. SRS2]KKC24180.1 dehydrogenase [Sphingomonas sp. SRS2]